MAYTSRNNKSQDSGIKSLSANDKINSPKEEAVEKATPLDTLILSDAQSKVINKTFGRPDDYIELHIYNNNNQLIHSENYFEDYITPTNQDVKAPLTNKIQIDPNKVLNDRGFFSGRYIIKLNILKNKVFNTDQFPFFIKEISSDRREIKSVTPKTTNTILGPAISKFIADLESSVYFKEFSINFGNDILIPSINILLNKDPNKHEVLIKTLSTLPEIIITNSSFRIVEEITDPLLIRADLGDLLFEDEGIPIAGPNFTIDTRINNSVPSDFKTYNDILNYNVTSSYQHLLSKLEDDTIDLDIKYDNIRPVSESSIEETYHFENFTHFSNATERLKNFKYKLELVESYDKQLGEIGAITGATTSSNVIFINKNNINNKKEKIIKGLDGYEQFLYFTSGAYAWPKQNQLKPYTLYSVSSSEAKTWFGEERSNYSYYGGQILSASLFDKQNEYSLNRLIPTHIVENTNNSLYVNFVNMVGHHFDHIWTYIKAISNIHNTDNIKGISKDLVYHKLRSIGLEVFDQFENTSLTEYMLGIGSGSSTYDVGFRFGEDSVSGSTVPSETMITASNESIPKGDITKEVWKRLYHNSSYLLKTKGTERGIRALMSCYGIPSTILNIKEYGGSTTTSGIYKDLDTSDTYKTFTYRKSGLALKGTSGTGGFFIKTPWSSSLGGGAHASFSATQEDNKTVEFRIKPTRSTNKYHLFSLSGSHSNTTSTHYPAADNHLLLDPYTGNDISSSDDSTNYGRIQYYIGEDLTKQTQYFPIYDGDFWNIFIQANKASSNSKIDIKFGAYKANFNKNIHYHTTSSTALGSNNYYIYSWGRRTNASLGGNGAKYAYFGGVPANADSEYNSIDGLVYSGSLQEIKYHFGELLSHNTLKKHALEPFMYSGNTISSSYDNLVLRLPLGSNDMEDSSSFHPNEDSNYLGGGTSSITAQEWEEVVENHHLPTPDTVGASMTSEKVRIDEGTIDQNLLSPFIKSETSTLDRQPQDFEDLGIFFSPTNEINEDILYTLGPFRMDDYIGSPLTTAQSSSTYEDLKALKDIYFKKVKRRYNYWDYTKQIQYIDHTLFKMIEQFVPARANTKTGLLIEPHFLERTKLKRTLPVRTDGQTMTEGLHQTFEGQLASTFNNKMYKIASSSNPDTVEGQWDPGSYVIGHNNVDLFVTSSNGRRKELGTNTTIYIYEEYINPSGKDPNRENNQSCQSPIKPFVTTKPSGYKSHESSVLLGNTIGGRKSNKYYKYAEYNMTTSSLYINQA